MTEEEEQEKRTDHAALEIGFLGLEGASCCLFSLLGSLALLLLPVSVLLLMIR